MSEGVRKRSRAMALEPGGTEKVQQPTTGGEKFSPPDEMVEAARRAYHLNKDKNRATREEKAALRALEQQCAQHDPFPGFTFTDGDGDKRKVVEVQYGPTEKEVLTPLEVVEALGGGEDAMRRVLEQCSIAAGAVKDSLGSNILAKAIRTVPGDYKLSVKEQK